MPTSSTSWDVFPADPADPVAVHGISSNPLRGEQYVEEKARLAYIEVAFTAMGAHALSPIARPDGDGAGVTIVPVQQGDTQ